MRAGPLSLDAFLGQRAVDRRLARLTHDLPLPEAVGLEFGPGDNPVPLPNGMRVAYVDRCIDAAPDQTGPSPIDHAWDGATSLAAVLGDASAPSGFDFAVAAQVAQYVPNLLGWLRGIHAVLRPGGVLNLSLPDRRFMFDAARASSTLPELIEADLLGLTRPSPRQLFAHTSEVRAISPNDIWAGADAHRADRLAGTQALSHALNQTRTALAQGCYIACHCWVFSPRSFLDLVEGATRLGLLPFVLNHVSSTEPGSFEFFVSMRRDLQEEPDVLRALQEGAIAHLRGTLDRQARHAALIAQF
ncbi:hypothetical protein ASF58_24260 [Methylobacterium sp. Leaf125]|uniref:class I SAM-dependent methyltransferase n=1 Tax=Methylobacterium sp. Leaf125 TaxID=1736265 RepID=UPI0006FD57EE|nr:methyltransferase domain-containing protein [Methylobacterium sp. Leaf125]KQQ32584.1 hypothetical protein ASF58_24260 [Methylobacterium sp. Leaf125]